MDTSDCSRVRVRKGLLDTACCTVITTVAVTHCGDIHWSNQSDHVLHLETLSPPCACACTRLMHFGALETRLQRRQAMACLHLLLPDLGSVPAYEAGIACVQGSLRERQVSLSTSLCASVVSKSILSHMHSMGYLWHPLLLSVPCAAALHPRVQHSVVMQLRCMNKGWWRPASDLEQQAARTHKEDTPTHIRQSDRQTERERGRELRVYLESKLARGEAAGRRKVGR